MKIIVFVLYKNSEVYTKYASVDAALAFLQRTGYLTDRSVIVTKNEKAKYFEKINDLNDLRKEAMEFVTNG